MDESSRKVLEACFTYLKEKGLVCCVDATGEFRLLETNEIDQTYRVLHSLEEIGQLDYPRLCLNYLVCEVVHMIGVKILSS